VDSPGNRTKFNHKEITVNKKTEKELLCELKQATKAMDASRVRLNLALRCGSQAEIEEVHS